MRNTDAQHRYANHKLSVGPAYPDPEGLLYICHPQLIARQGYGQYLASPSRFLQGLPEEIYERLLLEMEPVQPAQLPETPPSCEKRHTKADCGF